MAIKNKNGMRNAVYIAAALASLTGAEKARAAEEAGEKPGTEYEASLDTRHNYLWRGENAVHGQTLETQLDGVKACGDNEFDVSIWALWLPKSAREIDIEAGYTKYFGDRGLGIRAVTYVTPNRFNPKSWEHEDELKPAAYLTGPFNSQIELEAALGEKLDFNHGSIVVLKGKSPFNLKAGTGINSGEPPYLQAGMSYDIGNFSIEGELSKKGSRRPIGSAGIRYSF